MALLRRASIIIVCTMVLSDFVDDVHGLAAPVVINPSINKANTQIPSENGDSKTVLTTNKPTICKYLITKKYTCQVPIMCNNTHDTEFSCFETVDGIWSDSDDIVHWHDVCVWTDHFSTCTFNIDQSYNCRMVWEQRHHPKGFFTGNALSGFQKVISPGGNQTGKPELVTRSKESRQVKKVGRRRRSGGGTC